MANDFSVQMCKAHWQFESGALGTDSKGTNHLTPYAAGATPTSVTDDQREGAGCALFTRASNQYFFIPDHLLDSGFPLKFGDPVKKATIAFWIKFNSLPGSGQYHEILCKSWYNLDGGFEIQADYSGGPRFTLIWAYSATAQTVWRPFTPVTGRWYHVTVRIDGGPSKVWKCRVYDAAAGTTNNYTGAPGGEMHVSSRPLYIGAYGDGVNCLDGRLDELLFFNDVLSDTECANVQAGTFDFGDARLKARYRFEAGALTADSKGGNTLINGGTLPAADTADYRVGSSSLALLGGTQHLRIADVNLNTNFPWKNGDAWKFGSWCGWFKPLSTGVLFGKWTSSNGRFKIFLKGDLHLYIDSNYGATGMWSQDTGITLTLGRWYFLGFAGNGNAVGGYYKNRIYVWDTTTDTVSTYDFNHGTGWYASTADFSIGAAGDGGYSMVCKVDDFQVFEEWLFDEEFQNIRQNKFLGYNDFGSEPNLQAAYDFESSTLADSKNGNDLTSVGLMTGFPGFFGADGRDRKKGAIGAGFDRNFANGTPYFKIDDANLSAGFPLKSGDATKRISLCGWFKFTDTIWFSTLWSKAATSQFTFDAYVWPGLTLRFGYNNGASSQTIYDSFNAQVGRWYHIALTIDGLAKTYSIRIWDDTSQAIVRNTSGIFSNELYVGTAPFQIGATSGATWPNLGYCDQHGVYNNVLTTAEIDEIRANTNLHGPVSLWNFDPGAFTADSVGTNTLTAMGGTMIAAPENKRGAGAVWMHCYPSQFGFRYDSQLSSDFPLKNGDSAKKISICCWLRPWSFDLAYNNILIAKGENGKHSLALRVCYYAGPANRMAIQCGYNNGASYEEFWSPDNLLTTWYWYHVGVVIDGIARTCYVRLYSLFQNQVIWDQTFNLSNELWVGNGAFSLSRQLGRDAFYDGGLDEVLIFNRLLSSDEIDMIRKRLFVVTDEQKIVHIGVFMEYGYPETVPNREFPVPPSRRLVQSQTGRRVFPVVK
jgi:hypothetical protein